MLQLLFKSMKPIIRYESEITNLSSRTAQRIGNYRTESILGHHQILVELVKRICPTPGNAGHSQSVTTNR
jgi:hypothetical protein